jgi:transcriptional regulator with XRE-family HTH domain
MATKTPIAVNRSMRTIAYNFDLARRQQRVTVELLAERCGISVPTVRKLLNQGQGSLENFLRVARSLGFLDAVTTATDPLNTPLGKIRAEEDTPRRVRY